MQPYVLELAVSLWGRDLLKDMGFKLSNEYSDTAKRIMQGMGCVPGRGIGRYLQDCMSPIPVQQRQKTTRPGFFIGAAEEGIPITWKTEEPVWVPQWPLSSEKLVAAKTLVAEQLSLNHIKPSVSPWNTPIFVIKKRSGKWGLLHDLHAINQQMQIMGPIQ